MHPPDCASCSDRARGRARSALFRVTARGYFVNASKDGEISFAPAIFFPLPQLHPAAGSAAFLRSTLRWKQTATQSRLRPCVGSRVVRARFMHDKPKTTDTEDLVRDYLTAPARARDEPGKRIRAEREKSPGLLPGACRDVEMGRARSIRSAGIEEN